MTVYDQPATSFSDTTGHQRVISEAVFMLSPKDTPLILALGGLDAARNKFKLRMNGEKIELIEDTLMATSGAAAQGTTILTTDTALTVADASIFQDGDVILFDDSSEETCVITAVDVTNNTITLASRTYGGTRSTHASTVTLQIVSMNRKEGDTADYRGLTVKSYPYNYTSTFEKAVKVTGKMRAIDQYGGISDEMDYQDKKVIPELSILLNRACYWGVRTQSDSSNLRSSMGGLFTFITDNTVSAGSTAVTKTVIDSLAESIAEDGGAPDLFVCNPTTARDMYALLDNSSFIQLDYSNTMLGMSAITGVRTQFGTMAIIEDRHCPKTKAFMLDSRKAGLYTLRPFSSRPLGVTGDFDAMEYVGEFSLLVANDKAHGYITNITT